MPSGQLKFSLPLQKLKFELDIEELLIEEEKSLDMQKGSDTPYDNSKQITDLLQKIISLKGKFDQRAERVGPNGEPDALASVKNELEATINSARLEVKKRDIFYKIYMSLNQSLPVRKKVAKHIFDFVWSLSNQISISAVILFGSQVTGTAHKWSDIDLAIISPEFENRSRFYRKAFLTRVAISTNATKIQAVGYSLSEWSSNRLDGFAMIVKKTGISILSFPGN